MIVSMNNAAIGLVMCIVNTVDGRPVVTYYYAN